MSRHSVGGWIELIVCVATLIALQSLAGPPVAVAGLLLYQYARLIYRLRYRGVAERVFPGLTVLDYLVSALLVLVLVACLIGFALQGSPWWLGLWTVVLVAMPLYFALRFSRIRAGSTVALTANAIFGDG